MYIIHVYLVHHTASLVLTTSQARASGYKRFEYDEKRKTYVPKWLQVDVFCTAVGFVTNFSGLCVYKNII